MTATANAQPACPSWCNGKCHKDDERLHVQCDIQITGPTYGHRHDVALSLSLSRDDNFVGAPHGEPRIWLDSYDIGLDQAEQLAVQLAALVALGRKP